MNTDPFPYVLSSLFPKLLTLTPPTPIFPREALLAFSPQTLPEVPLFTDTVAFRVAPWIMTPNTQPPKEVYVCR